MATPVRVLSHLGEMPEVAATLPGVEIVAIPADGDLDDGVEGEVLLTLMSGSPNLEHVLSRGVRWVHTIGTGVDQFPLHVLGDTILTCSRGASAVPIAEWVMAQILAVEKHLPDVWVHEPPKSWGLVALGGLAGERLAVFGFGSIGTAIARRGLAFDMSVRALRRTDAPSALAGVEMTTGVDALLDGADHVVVAAPSTVDTKGVVDARFLAAMKPGAHLVNIARGDLVDEDALRAALDSGHVGIASLDVATTEPLPAGHWLYEHPRVHFSPHVSWSAPGVWESLQRTFADNLARWVAGDALDGVVDVDAGY